MALRYQVGPFDCVPVDFDEVAGAEQRAATCVAPVADQRGQHINAAHCHPAVGVPLHPVAEANGGGFGGSVGAGQFGDDLGLGAGNLRHPLHRIFLHPFAQLLKTMRILFYIFLVI